MECLKMLLPISIEILSIGLVVLPQTLITIFGKPIQRGFFCNDNSIKYPYKNDTITGLQIGFGSIIISTLLFIGFEIIHCITKRSTNSPVEMTGRGSIPNFIVMLYNVFAVYVFGLMGSSTIAIITKYMSGRLRPHFLSVCKPDLTKLNCSSEEFMSVYIEEDICTRSYDNILKEARMSFPSGHCTTAAFTAIFLALYIQEQMTWKSVKALRPCLQAMLAFAAVFVCVSRVSDNQHHWSDVVAGAFLGTVAAVLTGLHLVQSLKASKRMELQHQTLPYHAVNSHDAPSEKTPLVK